MVDEVSSVSQQTAAEATTVSAASEEQTSSLSEMALTIEQLSETAEALHNSVDDFEVGEPGAAGPAAVEAETDIATRTSETMASATQPSTTGRAATPAEVDSEATQSLLAVEEVEETKTASSNNSIPWSDLEGGEPADDTVRANNSRGKSSGGDQS